MESSVRKRPETVTTAHGVQHDTTHSWEALMGAMNSYDDTMINDWISSMNNLLVFVYRSRGTSSVRESVRLRQLRYNSLFNWGVPDIISLLPVLLQAALILFLAGVLMLLWSVNNIAAGTVTAFLVIPLVFSASSAILPLVQESCPYKTPMSTIALSVWLMGEVVVAHMVILTLVLFLGLTGLGLLIAKCFGRQKTAFALFSGTSLRRRLMQIAGWSRWSRARLTARAQWVERDVQQVHRTRRLDLSALTWALHALPGSSLSQIHDCLLDLSPDERSETALTWTAQAFDINQPEAMESYIVDAMIIKRTSAMPSDPGAVVRGRQLLLKYLPEWDSADRRTGPAMLLILRHLVRLDPPPEESYVARYGAALAKARMDNKDIDFSNDYEPDRFRVISRCSLDFFAMWKPSMEDRDIDQLVEWVTANVQAAYPAGTPGIGYDFERHDGVICALTSAFLAHDLEAAAPLTSTTSEHLSALIQQLRSFVQREKQAITFTAHTSFDSRPDSARFAAPVWPTLCASLLSLAERTPPVLPPPDQTMPLLEDLSVVFTKGNEHLRSLLPTLDRLRDACGRTADKQSEMSPADSEHRSLDEPALRYMYSGDRAAPQPTDSDGISQSESSWRPTTGPFTRAHPTDNVSRLPLAVVVPVPQDSTGEGVQGPRS